MTKDFEALRADEGVWHIRDAMGVCVTLLVGREKAILVDTAYGLGDLRGFIREITPLEPRVVLTHGHHDHALGAMAFETVDLNAADREVYAEYTSPKQRKRVLSQAAGKGILLSAEEEALFLARPMASVREIAEEEADLGGMTARLIPCPGHTPGSLLVLVPERGLLLTGDNYNPCTWVFFHESLGPRSYRENMKKALSLPFDRVLCPHDAAVQPRERMERFFASIGDEALEAAKPSPAGEGAGVETRQVRTEDGQLFVFSWQKYLMGL